VQVQLRWFVLLSAGALAVAAANASGLVDGGWAFGQGGATYLVAMAAATIACTSATRRSQGPARRAWLLVTVALVLNLVGDVLWTAQDALGDTPYVSVADVFYLAAYPPFALALWTLARSRDPEDGSQSVLDGVAVATGLSVLAWQLVVVAPGGLGEAEGALQAVVLVAYPFLDLTVLAALVAILLGTGRRAPALWWLLGFLGAWVVTDIGYASIAYEADELVAWTDVGYLLAFCAVGVAALHPSATRIADRQPPSPPSWRRFVLLGASLAAPSATAAVAVTFFDGVQPALLLVSSLALAALFAVRGARAVIAERRIADVAKAAERALDRRMRTDPLTELPNRTALLDRLVGEDPDAPLAALFVDLDRFKVVNDAAGHATGDVVLRQAAARLRARIRSTDAVYRLAGDEFVVLCPGIEAWEALEIAGRVLGGLDAPFVVDGLEWFVGCSIGVAVHPGGRPIDPDRLIREADMAMFAAKHDGRRGVRVFDLRMQEGLVERHRLEVELRRAIENDELDVAFQPIVRLADGEVAGFEILTRWWERGQVQPTAQVIEVAEQAGLIGDIDRRTLDRACRFIARFNDRDLDRAPAFVTVNLSTRDLAAGGMAARVSKALTVSGIDPSWLVLELTEGALDIDPDLAGRRLSALHDLGVRLAIDDFGTGYSSLAHLIRFPVDVVKVDRLFVRELAMATKSRSGAAAVLKVAETLGITPLAEGVETAEQAASLTALGYELAQGYYFARPMSEVDAERVGRPSARPGVATRRPVDAVGGGSGFAPEDGASGPDGRRVPAAAEVADRAGVRPTSA
jgi:diguanylate cyclase (GGDEF)-like protein